MTCFYCAADMIETTTTYFQEFENIMVIIKNVPCFKCKKCGEFAYTATVVRRLEQITKELEKTLTEIAIVNYSAA